VSETETPLTVWTKDNPKPKMRLSASRLQTWMTCPMQARFQYIDRLPQKQNSAASFGNCVHAALEEFCKTHNLDEALKLFEYYWTNPDVLGVTPDIWIKGTSFGGYMEKGKDSIRMYAESKKWIKREFIASEHSFLVPFGDFELTGKVDLLEFSTDKNGYDSVKITDFKTNKKKPFMGNLRLNIQFTIYDYASRQPEFWYGVPQETPEGEKDYETFPALTLKDTLFNSPDDAWERAQQCTRDPSWFGLMQAQEWSCGERNNSDYARLYRVAKEVEKAIDNNVFVPNISGDSCTFCPYVDPCRLPFDPRPGADNTERDDI
jgi:hypothetical protein